MKPNCVRLCLIMIVLIELSCLIECYPTYEEYVQQFNKNYSPQELQGRKLLYNARVQSFSLITSFVPGVNNFTDWTDIEIDRLRNLNTMPENQRTQSPKLSARKVGAPDSLDYRNSGILTSVKNQGNCGACWAFATVATAQAYLVKQGKYSNSNIDLSQQYLLSCTQNSDCRGGYLQYSFEKIHKCATESQYPYTPSSTPSGICSASTIEVATGHKSYYDLSDWDIIDLLQNGPVGVGVSATGWESYSSGTLSCSPGAAVNHAVVLVGYTADAWIIKNSWDTTWGMAGYAYITRNPYINCRIGVGVFQLSQHMTAFLIILQVFLFMILY